MDKLNTELYGGFPWDLNDWRWELDSHRKVIGALADGLSGGSPLIVSGLGLIFAPGPLTPGIGVVTHGWVAWNGELFEYAGGAGNPSISPLLHYLKLDVSTDPAGPETFQDGSSQNAYERRRLVLVATGASHASDPAYVPLVATPRLKDLIAPGPWTQVTSFSPDFDSPNGLYFRIEPGKVLRYRGSVRLAVPPNAMSGSGEAFFMPTSLRPSAALSAPVVMTPQLGFPTVVPFFVNATYNAYSQGEVGVLGATLSNQYDRLDLSLVSYPVVG